MSVNAVQRPVGRKGILAAALVLAAAAAPAADLPEPGEYAWGFPLSGGGDGEYRAATLPLAVYRAVTDPQLRDLGVYNAAGQAVPRVVQPPPAPPEVPERSITLQPIPLAGPPAAQRERLRLLMQQGASGTTLSLDTGDAAAAPPPDHAAPPVETPATAYIVDLRTLDGPLDALRFDWGDSAAGFIGIVRVDTGDDLQDWRLLARATLADLAQGDTEIVQNRAVLNATPGDFLRIRWSGLPDGWRLRALTGLRRTDGDRAARDWLELEPVAVGEDGRSLRFDAAGFPPVDRVNLGLPGDNVILRARIEQRPADDAAWRAAYSGVFYHVRRDGASVESPPAGVTPVRSAQWRVVIESGATPNGGADALRLRLGWRPERLLFVAQGPAPYVLAAGRARDRAENFPQQRLLGDRAIFRLLEEAGPPAAVTIEPRETLAGQAALGAGQRAALRTALVWAGLIVAVLLVGWLAVSLLREIRSGTESG